MLNGNVFREAKDLLRDKNIFELNEEELTTVKPALIPLDILPEFNDKTTDQGLEELAKIWDEANVAGVTGEPLSKRNPGKESEPGSGVE